MRWDDVHAHLPRPSITGGLILIASAVSAVALLALPPLQFAIILAGAFLLLGILYQPFLGFVLFVLIGTFLPYSTIEFGLRLTVSEALLALTWLGVSLHLLLGKTHWHIGRTERVLIALMLFSVLPFVVGQLTITVPGNGTENWLRWLLNLSALFLVPMLVTNVQRRDQLVVAMLLGNLIMLLFSLTVWLRHADSNDMIPILAALKYSHPESFSNIFGAEHARLATPWVHPNLSGGALVLFLPLALLGTIVWRGWRRWLGIGVATLGSVAVLLSGSRGAMLSMVAILSLLAWWRVPLTRTILLAGFGLGVLIGGAYPPLAARLATMFSSKNASTEIRFDEYRRFPEVIQTYPLGIGFKVDPPVPGSGLLNISNLWLNYVWKLGVIGMLLFIVVTWRWWQEVKPRERILQVNDDTYIWIGSMGGVLAALTTGFFDHYYSFSMVLLALFWVVIGLSLQDARHLKAINSYSTTRPS